jgi:antagonist of KipI
MSLHVLEPGLFSLIVDLGRPHTRSLGVPIDGAADRTSLMLGNVLLGNLPDAAALEISLTGPTLRADGELACVVYGAPFDLRCGVRPVRVGQTFTLHAGEVLRIAGTREGMRAYLCVRGGIQAPLILGSRSALGPIRAGQDIPCHRGSIGGRYFQQPEALRCWDRSRLVLRVLDGPQRDWFPEEAIRGLLAGAAPVFTVTPDSNRMGLRLKGPPLPLPAQELLSEPVSPGAVQVTGGQCIILGIGGQTIGGYPKVAQVISADLDKLGQLRPGDAVRLVRVDLAEAERAYRQQTAELRRWLSRLELAETS